MILPYFDYGDVIYNSASQESLDKLQRLQNRCLKICKNLNVRHDTKDLHRITKMPMLTDRRKAHVNNFMFARTNNVTLIDNRNIRTRAHDAPLFRLDIPKNEAYKRSIRYAGALQWNNLDIDTCKIPNFKMFKARQKQEMTRN